MTFATSRSELGRRLASAGFNAYLSIPIAGDRADECTIGVPFRDEFDRPGGALSAPVFMAAADVAIWLARLSRAAR